MERVLSTRDETEAVRQTNAARPGKPTEEAPVLERLPPGKFSANCSSVISTSRQEDAAG